MKYFLDMYLVFVYWMKIKEPNVSVEKVMPHLVQMAVLILMSAQMVIYYMILEEDVSFSPSGHIPLILDL